MDRRTKLVFAVSIVALGALVTLPLWGMGPAVFFDSQRTVISRLLSPDGKRVAQIERIVVGGEPTIVVSVRSSWVPDWYLAGCAAASHYQNEKARVRWTSNSALEVGHMDDRRFWATGSAPFHQGACSNLTVTFAKELG